MTRIYSAALLLVLSILARPCIAQEFTILHLNDTHSNLLPSAPRDASGIALHGGFARAATVVGQTRVSHDNVLVLHAGDSFIGDPMFNLLYDQPAELSLLAGLGIDAMAVGNHEFDLGPLGLLQALSNTLGATPPFPLLSANLDLSDDAVAPLNLYIKPTVIKEFDGLKVGIFALTTPSTNYFSNPAPVKVLGEVPDELAAIILQQIEALHNAQCEVVILLSHMGLDVDRMLAAAIPGIDIIIGGHDHVALQQPMRVSNPLGTDVLIVQTGGHYEQLGRMRLMHDAQGLRLLEYELVLLDERVPEEATSAATLSAIATGIEQHVPGLYSARIGYCAQTLSEIAPDPRELGRKDTDVGSLVADAFVAATGADIGLQPGGSTARTLHAGPLYLIDVYRMIGYGMNEENGLGFPVVTFRMSGAALKQGLDTTLANLSASDELFMQVSSSMYYSYEANSGDPSPLREIRINGNELDSSATYIVASNQLVALFLQMYGIPFDSLTILRDSSGALLTEFQVVAGYVSAMGTVDAIADSVRIRSLYPTGVHPAAPSRSLGVHLQCSPQPCRDMSRITFQLEREQQLRLSVYDLGGRELRVLAEGRFAEGEHHATWNSAGQVPGVYFLVARNAAGQCTALRMLSVR
ncbi:MAG TPA: bifunctional UDP-sugar hydrolase/5'-nucleotidase [Bacteroidota bacterium]|nr:bifunctional UDP-sugar hydrolase/5'-nucleotidase [Bacteroidota bacterium]